MEYQEVLARRQSCRKYIEKPVEREKLLACLEAGRASPSGCNSQRWVFVAVDDPRRCHKLAVAAADFELQINTFAQQIPSYIAIVDHPPRRLTPNQELLLGSADRSLIDIGIAAQQICLAATDLGLGSLMMAWFDQQQVKEALDVPPEREVVLLIGIGYPATETIRRRSRYPAREIFRWNSYAAKGEGFDGQ